MAEAESSKPKVAKYVTCSCPRGRHLKSWADRHLPHVRKYKTHDDAEAAAGEGEKKEE